MTDASSVGTRPVVFIHTNAVQLVAAMVGAYALTTRTTHPDAFAVRLLRLEEVPHLHGREGQSYVARGRRLRWHNRDAQSHSLLRMMVPQVMGFRGRALVLDPDVFAVGDVNELLQRDMADRAILCRTRPTRGAAAPRQYASSVMLLDCARLTHWQWERQIDAVFDGTLDVFAWMALQMEPPETIGLFAAEWNHFDTLDARTKLLHNTERLTQPWKTGLAIDFDLNLVGAEPLARQGPLTRIRRALRRLSTTARPATYQPHPDARQERYFFALLRECLDRRIIDEAFLREEIRQAHLRADAFERLDACADSGTSGSGCR